MSLSKYGSQQYKIKQLDLTSIPPGKVIYVIGKRGSGKSWLTNDLIYTFRGYPYGLFLNGTPGGAPYIDAVPSTFMHTNYSPEVLENFYSFVDSKCNERKALGLEPLPSLIVFDDLSYEKKTLAKDKTFHQIIRNGRNRKITIIYIMHDVTDLQNDMRDQSDYVFAYFNIKKSSKERLYKYFFGQFPDQKTFDHVFTKITGDYTAMVCDCTAISNSIEDTTFYYKAEEPKPFIFGSQNYWNFHLKNFIRDPNERKAEMRKMIMENKRKRLEKDREMIEVVKVERDRNYNKRKRSNHYNRSEYSDDSSYDNDNSDNENDDDYDDNNFREAKVIKTFK